MGKTPATRTLSIRLPEDLADRLEAVARQYNMTRTAVLIEVLDEAIETYSPATQQQSIVQHDTLSGAIEALRIELDETIDRVARLERATQLATRPATQTARQPARPRDPDKPGRSLGQIAFDLKLTQKPTDRNYDDRCKSRYGVTLRDYLTSEGWTQQGRAWVEPQVKGNQG